MKGKVLVVEDDVYLLEGIRDILELAGYEVVTANSGKEGLNVLQADNKLPDLIVSDIMMPEMDGYEFLNAIRSNTTWLEIPFIFLTAKGERADKNLGKELGADDYVAKPFEPNDLLVAVSAKLRRAYQLKQRQDQMVLSIKRSILTILYHEFNTPLTYVIAYNDMLKQGPEALTADILRQYLSGVDAGATRLRHLVEDFILLVELETGESQESFVLHRRPIKDYAKILAPLIDEYKPEISAQRQTLQIEIDPATPPMLAYEAYLVKAVRCLLDNAMKFGAADNNITLRVTPYNDDHYVVCFAISDQGRGIPEEHMEKIFEPFYQIDREAFEDQGSGAGLAIVKRITELHGGKVQVESIVGEGSTFYLLFPAGSE